MSKLYIQTKCTIWEESIIDSSKFNVDDMNDEKIYNLINTSNNVETLFDTIEYMSPKENKNLPTIAVYDENKNLIWFNKKD